MEFNYINLCGLVIIAIIMVPNIIYAIRTTKTGGEENKCHVLLVNIMEQAGRYASMALMMLPLLVWKFSFETDSAYWVYFLGNGALLGAYLFVWLLYFQKRTLLKALVLAIVPTAIFILSGITLGHWLLVISGVIFGIGHIFITVVNNKDIIG